MSPTHRQGSFHGARMYRTRRRRAVRRAAVVGTLALAIAVAAVAWAATGKGRGPAQPQPALTHSGKPAASHGPTTQPSRSASPSTALPSSQRYLVAAWSRGDLASLAAAHAAGAINEVDVDWWHCRADGTLVPELVNPVFVTTAHADGATVFATITNRRNDNAAFDPAIAEAIIATPATRAAFARSLVGLCETRNYDGIDLDWESLHAGDRAAFTAFVQTLAVRLHRAGKRLSIAVYDKQTDYPSGPEAGARAAEDYRALGRAVDEFKVMTYGEHGSFTGPGPLSSPAWMTHVLAYTESQVDPAKVWLGIPFYGFNWGLGRPRYLLWTDVQKLLVQYHPAVLRSVSGEAYFRYTSFAGVRHTVYFQDRAAVAGKIAYLTSLRPRLAGIAIWVMGGEDHGFWPVIAQGLR